VPIDLLRKESQSCDSILYSETHHRRASGLVPKFDRSEVPKKKREKADTILVLVQFGRQLNAMNRKGAKNRNWGIGQKLQVSSTSAERGRPKVAAECDNP